VAEVRPFRGLRYAPDRVPDLSTVVCPPYDVISPEEAGHLRASSPLNAVRLELPEGAPEPDAADSRYAAAARTLGQWRAEGILIREEQPALYLVEESFVWDGVPKQRRGVLGAVRLADWSERVVLPHERTLSGPKADRLALLRACAANLSPVFLLYRRDADAERALWQATDGAPPLLEVRAAEGVVTRVWVLTEGGEQWRAALASRSLYVADGHHRYETALRYRDERRAAGGGAGEYDYVLSYLVAIDDPGLLVLPTHRCLPADGVDRRRLEALVAERFESEAQGLDSGDGMAVGAVLRELARRGERGTAFALYKSGGFRFLTPRAGADRWLPAERDAAWRALDVAQLESLLLEPLLGPAAPERLTYTRSATEAVGLVDSGAASGAFLLNPSPPAQIAAVADAGERMPQKSTYFYPKLPTGLVFHLLD